MKRFRKNAQKNVEISELEDIQLANVLISQKKSEEKKKL